MPPFLLAQQHTTEERGSPALFLKINPTFRKFFSLTTAPQILRVERRFLTIALMYGIITAEKEFMRSWIFDFSITTISQRNELDHTFDHLRLRTVWKQCLQEHPKAPISDSKAPKSLVNQAKNRLFSVWEHDVAGSNPVIPTKTASGTI